LPPRLCPARSTVSPGANGLQQRFQVGDVIGVPVALRLPRALAVAAKIRRDHVALARERIDQELERRRDVHPAVQQEELRRRGVAPGEHMGIEAAQRDAMRAVGLHSSIRDITFRAEARRGVRHFFLHNAKPSVQPVR
jgi:hypothetical protein